MSRARATLLAALVVLPFGGYPAVAETDPTGPAPSRPVIEAGATQPAFDPAKAIREDVFVTSDADSDGNGRKDRVHVQIVRPRGTSTGMRVPVVLRASPYFAGGNEVTNHNVDRELYVPDRSRARSAPRTRGGSRTARPTYPRIDWAYEDFLLARGYAVAYAESLGSGASEGCPTSGAGNETLGAKSVVEWLGGRAPAHDPGGEAVEARWSTGKVAMMGVSYNGTLPNAVAATGVKGLETIVPIGAISSWYDYYRADGAVVAPGGYQGEDTDVLAKYVHTNDQDCSGVIARLRARQDRLTGDYGRFWARRDYVDKAARVDASVLMVHGLNDWNVKTKQAAQWYRALRENGVEHRIWWHQSGHRDPINLRRDAWLRTLNRWFTHYLHGVANGVRGRPHVTIQREDGSWHREREWPAVNAREVTLRPTEGGSARGGLRLFGRGRDKVDVVETLRDAPGKRAAYLAATKRSPHRLAYFTRGLPRPMRLSGTPRVDLRMSFGAPAANVTAMLVDRAPDGSITPITRGWTDPQNRRSISRSQAIVPGEWYRIRVAMMPDDYVLDAAHSLGLVLLSSDHDYTLRPSPGTRIDVDLQHSGLRLPVARPRGH